MTFPTNTREEIFNKMLADTVRILAPANPYLLHNALRAMEASLATGLADREKKFAILSKQFNPLTATGDFLTLWGLLKKVTRNPAAGAKGKWTANGTVGTTVPINTRWQSQAGDQYRNAADATVTAYSINVLSITRVGTEATVTTDGDHEFATNISTTISGVDQAEYNKTAVITVIGLNKFTYVVSGSPITPATGVNIIASADIAFGVAEAVDLGASTNLGGGAEITFLTPIPNINDEAFAQNDGFSGGTDVETEEAFRVRVVFAYQNPFSQFNDAQIIITCTSVPGVTRVWVHRITPVIGDVTIYFVRDNDADGIFPDSNEREAVKKELKTIIPALSEDEDVHVLSPTPKSSDFVFSGIDPDTSTMFEAIKDSLEEFFREEPDVGVNITQDNYRAAIQNTIDPASGEKVNTFTLTLPGGDIPVASGALAVLGNISRA